MLKNDLLILTFYLSFRSVNSELCNFVTSLSISSCTTLPLTSIKLATLFLTLVSLRLPVLPSHKARLRLYLSSYLRVGKYCSIVDL